MTLRDYFEGRARDGSWGSLYHGARDLRTYNFLTRRDCTTRLLAGAGPFERVLDVGCGTGDYLELARALGGIYTGIDFAPGMVREARERLGTSARLVVGDGEALPFADGAFDLVLALGYIAYFADPTRPLAEIHRVLQPGGTLVIQVGKADVFGILDRRVIHPLAIAVGRRAPTTLPPGWVNRRYGPGEFDRLVTSAGFRRVAHTYNHFHVSPGVVRRRLPGWSMRVSEALSGCCPRLARAFALNYVGRYVRPE